MSTDPELDRLNEVRRVALRAWDDLLDDAKYAEQSYWNTEHAYLKYKRSGIHRHQLLLQKHEILSTYLPSPELYRPEETQLVADDDYKERIE
jgi:hypothetical protein